MAAPLVSNVDPVNNATDVVLGTPIVIAFNQLMDHTSLSDRTFVMTGPGQTGVVTSEGLISDDPDVSTGREIVEGTLQAFNLGGGMGYTVLSFTPKHPLRPNVKYEMLLMGGDSDIGGDYVMNVGSEAMESSYLWSFTTGDGSIISPPDPSPLPTQLSRLNSDTIRVVPRAPIGNDLSEVIEIIFPEDIDPDSIDLADVLISIEAILGDPLVLLPNGLTSSAVINDNKLLITITGWPA
jgi:hypothetical protein